MQQPIHPPPNHQPSRRPSVVGPVILIILGLAFLAQNLGIFEFNVWTALWRLWPVWLIAVGLDLLLGRRTEWGTWAVLGVVIAIIGGALWFDASFGSFAGGTREPVSINQPVGNARSADVSIDSSFARLSLSAGSPEILVQGTVVALENERLEKDAYNSGDTLVFHLKSRIQRIFGLGLPTSGSLRPPDWDLRLSDQVPINLRIDTGVGDSRLDLSRIRLTGLEIDAGVGDTEIILPTTGGFRVDIDGGVGTITLRIPKALAVRINVDQGVGKVVVHGDFQREDNAYLSPGYDRAERRVVIEIDGGVGDLFIEHI